MCSVMLINAEAKRRSARNVRNTWNLNAERYVDFQYRTQYCSHFEFWKTGSELVNVGVRV
jgi:hypothetical protein